MANMVKRQLSEIGVNTDNVVDAQSLQSESLALLVDSVDILVQSLPATQKHLINAVKTGLLRNVAHLKNDIQDFKTESFSASQIRRVNSRLDKSIPLAELEVVTDTNTAKVTIPEAYAFEEYSDLIVQAVLYKDKLTDFDGYKPLVMDINMYRGRNNAGSTRVQPIKVADLEKEIKIELPAVPEKTLTCAFFNEEEGDWEALTCAEEHNSDSHVTCCANHLTRFALVPAEYLQVV